MTKEQQDRAWACLPKEVRSYLRKRYEVLRKGNYSDRISELRILFGDNLTSDTEPEVIDDSRFGSEADKEMLMVERNVIIEQYNKNLSHIRARQDFRDQIFSKAANDTLFLLFGDKCLPDTPDSSNLAHIGKDELEHRLEQTVQASVQVEPKPKFKVGEIVRNALCKREKLTIAEVCPLLKNNNQQYKVKEYPYLWNECELEPYTEESISQNSSENCDKENLNSKSENMEEKELNLAELLKGCENTEFFSISVGKVTFKAIYDYDDTHKVRTIRKDAVGNEYNVNFHSDGRRNKAGLQDLYPSEDLLRKYPLDAYSAWMEWKETRKPKRWTPQIGERIFWVNDNLTVSQDRFNNFETQRKRRAVGNEFKTGKEAQQAAKAVMETLAKFQEKSDR